MRIALRALRRVSLCPFQPTLCKTRGQLCPAPVAVIRQQRLFSNSICLRDEPAPALERAGTQIEDHDRLLELQARSRRLPLSCPGCGAASQTVVRNEPGYYPLTRSDVRNYVEAAKEEDTAFNEAIKTADKSTLDQLGLRQDVREQDTAIRKTPICDRCHNLKYHHTGEPILHPSIRSIQDIIEESPHKENHIYHVLDAADFPMSLIPNLQHNLNLPRLRTQNRRSKSRQYVRGRVAEVSFIITRADLLAPKEEQVNGLLAYLREVLRDALGHTDKNVRLGNVRLVSAKRGWWTTNVKKDIWNRGGGGWMVGKVNVGKSNLFEVVFPKGRGADANIGKLRREGRELALGAADDPSVDHNHPLDVDTETTALADSPTDINAEAVDQVEEDVPETEALSEELDELDLYDSDDSTSLLPPPQPETPFPIMPLVHHLPGTTASPIRIPFGSSKGELIDLPGVFRSSLDQHVQPLHRRELVMRTRITPDQHSIKPGQSLLLGGLIRITPTTPDLVFLAYSFTPMHAHLTSTEKAIALLNGERAMPVDVRSIMIESSRDKYKKAGRFTLAWDVTKKRAGPLTSPTAVKLKAEQLPFTIYSADLLIEGVGWVELVAQVRKKRSSSPLENLAGRIDKGLRDEEDMYTPLSPPLAADGEEGAGNKSELPTVEVFTPEGKFIGIRPPMGAWELGGKKPVPKHLQKTRPRRSMKSLKQSDTGRKMMREEGG